MNLQILLSGARVLCSVALSLFFTLSFVAPAFGATVGIIPTEGPEDDAVSRGITAALRGAVSDTAGLRDKGDITMTLDEARTSFSCFDEGAACMSQVGTLLGVDEMVWAHLERGPGVWTLRLQRLDVSLVELTQSATTTVPEGAGEQVRLNAMAAAFIRGEHLPESAVTELTVLSVPGGAEVSFNGQPQGISPVIIQASPGVHTLVLTHPRFARLERRLQISGTSQRVSIDLTAQGNTSAGAPATPPVGAGRPISFWFGMGAGGLAVVSAAAATTLSLRVSSLSDEAASETDEAHRQVLKTDFDDARLKANLTWGITGVAAATSLYLLVFHQSPEARSGGSVQVGAGPGGLMVLGTF